MTLYLTETGHVETVPLMTGHDLVYVIGLCGYRKNKDSLTPDQMASTIADEAFLDETYWTPKGLDVATITQRVVQLKLDDMLYKTIEDEALYLAGSWPIDRETSRFLETIHDTKPILSSEADNGFMYEGEDQEELCTRSERGRNFIKNVQKHIDLKRGFSVLDGVEKPLEEKKKPFFENLRTMFGLFGSKPKNNGLTP